MYDLISRDDALNSNYRMYDAKSGIEWVPVFHIEEVPSAEPELKWIPVTKRLPEKHQRVLVTIKRTDGEMRVRSGDYFDDYFWIDNGDYWKCNEVLAWMSLPEPWKGE